MSITITTTATRPAVATAALATCLYRPCILFSTRTKCPSSNPSQRKPCTPTLAHTYPSTRIISLLRIVAGEYACGADNNTFTKNKRNQKKMQISCFHINMLIVHTSKKKDIRRTQRVRMSKKKKKKEEAK